MTDDADLFRMGAARLARRLRERKVGALEACEAAIARIEKLDGEVNAVIVRDFDQARADAKAADAALARGEDRPLLGVPATVKESFDLRGYPTTWGFEMHREHRAREDALAVQRLKAAGAVVLGKTNVPPGLADWQSNNPIYGRTNNPYDVSRSAGGSSGGSAASIAMGYAALELGTDIGGSVRVPAAFCGVFGLKTSHGVIPMRGHSPGGADLAAPLLSVIGPIAREAEDIALALDVVAGPDGDAPANRLVLPAPRHGRLGGYRVFVMDGHPAAAVDAPVLAAIEDVADQLTREGATVARSSNHLPDMTKSWKLYQTMLHTIISRRGADPDARPPISAHAWMDALDDQHRLRKQWADFFRHFDIVLAPAFSTVAFPHTEEPDWRQRSLMINGEATSYGSQLAWASMATVGNLPSCAVPLGLDVDGLPLSLQAIGPYLEDKTCAHFAGLIARETPPPALAR
jgi:amidase